jgi:hypothetical protein
VLAVDDRHVAFCKYNGSVARIMFVAVSTLANEKLLERACKLLIKFQNILRNITQVIIRHRVKILFSSYHVQ